MSNFELSSPANDLSNRIWQAKNKAEGQADFFLTEEEKAGILAFVGKGCKEDTKRKLQQRLALPLKYWTSYGIYSRVELKGTGASYCCGQEWTSEMKTLRKCFMEL